ncbi:MAG: 50S ribosomal protein L11 methyltransferase [Synechococcaceae cyanobacterium]|nr:50S ribosomal protein L11 methyltransferase [Synechococcaceae cyanobacterium]
MLPQAPGWWRLEMACPAELEESLLWRLGDLGIARVALQQPPERPQDRELVAWLPEGDWPAGRHPELERALAPLGEPFGLALPPLRWRLQNDEDWSLSWKRHWQPDPVGERLLILPAWLEPPEELADRLVLRMDPGSAFGTGSHPTTRLCLEGLERLATNGALSAARVADLGCGSGILALAALALGARQAWACDTDSLAVLATTSNAKLNPQWCTPNGDEAFCVPELPAAGRLDVTQGSIEQLAQLLTGGPADVLLCNILAPVIGALCPAFHTVLNPLHGVGLLSGLLVEQAPELQEQLASAGWRAELSASQGPWALLTIRPQGSVA